jgi:hypothetical protein
MRGGGVRGQGWEAFQAHPQLAKGQCHRCALGVRRQGAQEALDGCGRRRRLRPRPRMRQRWGPPPMGLRLTAHPLF